MYICNPLIFSWRRVRVVEGARLESVYTGNCIKGSNPFVSAFAARLSQQKHRTFFYYFLSVKCSARCHPNISTCRLIYKFIPSVPTFIGVSTSKNQLAIPVIYNQVIKRFHTN